MRRFTQADWLAGKCTDDEFYSQFPPEQVTDSLKRHNDLMRKAQQRIDEIESPVNQLQSWRWYGGAIELTFASRAYGTLTEWVE